MNEENKQERASTAGAAKGGNTIFEGLTRFDIIPDEGAESIIGAEVGGRYFLAADVERLLANAGAPAKLDEETIFDIARLEGDETTHGFIFNKDSGFSIISFARRIESEVLGAHAGVAAGEPQTQVRKATDELSLPELAEEFRAVAALGCDYTISAGVCAKLYEAMTTPPAAPAPLTDERIIDLCEQNLGWLAGAKDEEIIGFARLIEREVAKAAPAAPAQAEQAQAEPVGYARESELAKLQDNRVAGVGMMILKEPGEGKAALYLAAPALPSQAEQADTAALKKERDRFERMFNAACVELGLVNEALDLDPDDGGAEPIIEAINELKAKIGAQAEQVAAVRRAALEDAAKVAIKVTAIPRDVLGPATVPMKSRAMAGEHVAVAIRSLATKEAAAQVPAAEAQQVARWWSMRGSVITAAINQEMVRFPVEDLSELLNVFDAALPDDPSTATSNDTGALGDTGGDRG